MSLAAAIYFQYWGKARPDDGQSVAYHLLPYHCLDVGAVAMSWWDNSPVIRQRFQVITQNQLSEPQLKAWLLFFVVLHDLGKFDIRFQLKASHVLAELFPQGYPADLPSLKLAHHYYHGERGFDWFVHEYNNLPITPEDECLDGWLSWLAAVAGHHGAIPFDTNDKSHELESLYIEDEWLTHNKKARYAWLVALAEIFLLPVGLNLEDTPTELTPVGKQWLAGFCAICDWVGSNETYGFTYNADATLGLHNYFNHQIRHLYQEKILEKAGLLHHVLPNLGVQALLKKQESPRQLQTLVDQLPHQPSLTIIEAPTGSGKTETALAYAWQLLASGVADSIVFALPTQATANAMLERLERFASIVFGTESNVLLAHGRAKYNSNFKALLQAASQSSAQHSEDIRVQCATWLAESRKRVFLGQIGVCTVDQVLLSVLPLKHKFVRGFGVMKSVLIVDEVHAYDQYMYGLLDSVIKQQALAGGSAILLSATLPSSQRQALISAWTQTYVTVKSDAPYPLITCVDLQGQQQSFVLTDEKQKPLPRTVFSKTYVCQDAYPDEALLQQVIRAVEQGALVGIVCNLVDHAQALANYLREHSHIIVDIFHARYGFADRQHHEQQVIADYGREAKRNKGRVLIATQVIEQSLDLDFDWLITQLCPVDLVFQRLGRLHRHQRPRPQGFEQAQCTVLLPKDQHYGLHELIYGNARVLWRTEQLLLQAIEGKIDFPKAYREWIERVYDHEDWSNEPETVSTSWDKFYITEKTKKGWAKQLTDPNRQPVSETDDNVRALTRDGEMSHGLVLCKQSQGQLWSGESFNQLDEYHKKEAINLNTVSVPHSWQKLGLLPDLTKVGEDEVRWLVLHKNIEGKWYAELSGGLLFYDTEFGLQRIHKQK